MDKPIYCVFKLVDGKSVEVGNATDSRSDAIRLCRSTFKESNCPVKVIESKVVHEVVYALYKESFHVSICVPSEGTITHYRNEDDFASAIRDLVSRSCRFDVVCHES